MQNSPNYISQGYFQGDFVSFKNRECIILREYNGLLELKDGNKTISTQISECSPIRVNLDWVEKFGCGVLKKIKNVNTAEDWVIKQVSEKCFYFTRDVAENPILSVNYVHELQGCLRRLRTKIIWS